MSTFNTSSATAKTELRRQMITQRASITTDQKQQWDTLRCVDVAVVAQGIKERNQLANYAPSPAQNCSDSDFDDCAESTLFDVVAERGPLDGLVVASYLSYGTEPGTQPIVDLMLDLGALVLAPVLTSTAGPRWAWYRGETALTSSGIPQPVGEALPPEALSLADLIIIPGLAGGRDGSRLGTGGGWYDRALPHARVDALRLLLLYAAEVYDTVPTDPHDQSVDAIITESGLIVIHRD
ncbi:MAG: 5-formyltetrahydrofolate cyclo-ligase [Propionibacteriaceae bacterium]|jgi:5-formyltetrahydrofolate cyclo-ligase|nr:5-formyltetrahydrofolate cyclo-ligase [Propionibacteriaceae bacterium]